MAKFLDKWKKKVTTYKTKAEEIRAMIEDGAETIRDIRADVEGTVEELKTDSEEKMMESLEKIQDAERVFEEAGYDLRAVELEMGFNPKVVAVLKHKTSVSSRKKEQLLKKHESDKLLKTVLTSLFKAEALEDKVHLQRLTFSEVHLEMGLVPAIHVMWEDKSTAGVATPKSHSASPSISTSPFTSSSSSFTSKGSSFTSRGSSFTDTATKEELPPQEPEPQLSATPENKEPIATSSEPSNLEEPASTEDSSSVESADLEESFSAPEVTASARDPEDDKWTSFPDISFPTAK
ncbi:MAG: hypothetical protein QF406_11950 [Verrucomicrobiota bacterium]|jgi:hypothetical protein|nr:hypothetical protein [Verrucomicrobiota bacterium]